jgi:hypothetical protein
LGDKEHELSELQERVKDLEAQLRDSTADATRLQEALDDIRPFHKKRSSIKDMLRLENINYVPPTTKELVPPKNNSRSGGGFSFSTAVSKDGTTVESGSMDEVIPNASKSEAIPPREFQSAPAVASINQTESLAPKEGKSEDALEKETDVPTISLVTETATEEELHSESTGTKQVDATTETPATAAKAETDVIPTNPSADAASKQPETDATSKQDSVVEGVEEEEHVDEVSKAEREDEDTTGDTVLSETPSYEEFIEVSKVGTMPEPGAVNESATTEPDEGKQKEVDSPEISTQASKEAAPSAKATKQRRGFFSKVLARKSKKSVE